MTVCSPTIEDTVNPNTKPNTRIVEFSQIKQKSSEIAMETIAKPEAVETILDKVKAMEGFDPELFADIRIIESSTAYNPLYAALLYATRSSGMPEDAVQWYVNNILGAVNLNVVTLELFKDFDKIYKIAQTVHGEENLTDGAISFYAEQLEGCFLINNFYDVYMAAREANARVTNAMGFGLTSIR